MWSSLGRGVTHSPTRRCRSYWKGGLLVTLDYSRQLYFLLIYSIYVYTNTRGHTHTHTHAPHGGWALWRRNLRLPLISYRALRMNWALWYPVRYKCKQNESYYIMPYNSRADVVRLLVEWYDTKSNLKLDWFRSQVQASYMSSYTEELKYNESLGVDNNIYIYIYIYIYI